VLSCKKKKTNEDLFNEASGSGLSFYKNKDTIYPPKGGSPHGDFKLKFNGTAKADLDASGKLPAGGSFSKGAMIVKEVYKNGVLDLIAIMKKDPDSRFASNKWIWAEYAPDGKTIYDVTKTGDACTGCHLSAGNRDLSLSFDLH
jgi:hypothetical protein